MKLKQVFVVDMRHDGGAEPDFAVFDCYDEAVDRAHKFFLSYDFSLVNGEPVDADGRSNFDNLKMSTGKVAQFMHCGGDGPCCVIQESEG